MVQVYTLPNSRFLMSSMPKITPVVLAGGAGSRLFPLSRDEFPKQFRPLLGETSTFQETVLRVANDEIYSAPVIITSEDYCNIARAQLEAIGLNGTIVGETARRDSAAAMAIAALIVEQISPGSLVLAVAADHVIPDAQVFNQTVEKGREAANAGQIVVFGLVPTEPKTSYGYIRSGKVYSGDPDVHEVEKFVEKPDQSTALKYMQDGYLWNSGNFLFRSDTMINEFEVHAPDILAAARDALAQAQNHDGVCLLNKDAMCRAPKTSIDIAVIERSQRISVVTGRFSWSDVGAWDAVWEVLSEHSTANVKVGKGHFYNSEGCLIHSETAQTIAVGLKDIVIVSTEDAVLVMPKGSSQDVKGIVLDLQRQGYFVPSEEAKT